MCHRIPWVSKPTITGEQDYPRNTAIPTRVGKVFTTVEDNQRMVKFMLCRVKARWPPKIIPWASLSCLVFYRYARSSQDEVTSILIPMALFMFLPRYCDRKRTRNKNLRTRGLDSNQIFEMSEKIAGPKSRKLQLMLNHSWKFSILSCRVQEFLNKNQERLLNIEKQEVQSVIEQINEVIASKDEAG